MSSKSDKISDSVHEISDYIGGLFRGTNTENDGESNIADMLYQMHNDFEAALPSGRDFKTFSLYNVKPDDIEVFTVGDDVRIRAKSVGAPSQFGYRRGVQTHNFW